MPCTLQLPANCSVLVSCGLPYHVVSHSTLFLATSTTQYPQYLQHPIVTHSTHYFFTVSSTTAPAVSKPPVQLSTTQYPKVPALFYILYIFVQNKNSVWFASFFVESFLLSKRFYFAMFKDIYSNELKKFRKNMLV